jgi:hypothetical protein
MSVRHTSAAILLLVVASLCTPSSFAQAPTPDRPPGTPPTLVPVEPERPASAVPLPEAPELAGDPGQRRPGPDEVVPLDPAPRRRMRITPRVFGLLGFQSFTATESFSAVLDTSSGMVVGGGGGLLFGRNLFVDVAVSRFAADGTRVFVAPGGEVFDLGIDTQVTVTPIDVSLGWRFAGAPRLDPNGRPRLRPVPFVGGGFGFQRYSETSAFADAGDDVSETHGSYHALGGLEVPFGRRLGATTEMLYRWVPDAIGAAGVSAVYDETDLGGLQIRVKVTWTF